MIKINLLPPELRSRKKVPFLDRTLIYILFSLILLIVLLVFVNFTQKNTISDLDNQIRTTQAEIKRYQPLIQAVDEARKLKDKIQERMAAIQVLEVERPLWVRTMEEFTSVLPEFVWYDDISYNSSTSIISLSAGSYSLNDIARFLINLKGSKYFTGVSLKGINKRQQNSGLELYSFSLRMTLVRDQTKGEVGQFRLTKKPEKKKPKDDLKKVDLEAKGREQLGVDKEKARKAMQGLAN